MKFKTYLNNRKIFESRFKPTDSGYSYIEPMLKGIRNKELFFKLYSFDKKFTFSSTVSSIDKTKRYSVRGQVGSKIKLTSNEYMFDKYEDEFKKALNYLNKHV